MANAVGAAYPEVVLQAQARTLALLQQKYAWDVQFELDSQKRQPSVELWTEVQFFVLYLIERAIRASERLNLSSQSRLSHLLMEEWTALVQLGRNPSQGFFGRTFISLLEVTGLGPRWTRDAYHKFSNEYDAFLTSSIRKASLKGCDDLSALTLRFFKRIQGGRTMEGQPISFSGTLNEIKGISAHLFDCFAEAGRCI